MEYKILLVDSIEVCRQCSKLHESTEFHISGYAHSTEEARCMLLNERYDLLITELLNKSIDGFRIISTIREAGGGTMAVITSARACFYNALRAIHEGVVDYLIKPFSAFEYSQMLINVRRRILETNYVKHSEMPGKNYPACELSRLLDAMGGFGLKVPEGIIQKICLFMFENVGKKDLMYLVEENFSLSRDHIGRLFKNKLGMTCNEVIVLLRIERSKWLLRETTEKIYAISEAVGYKTVDYFTGVFKQTVGVTPIQYRMGMGI